MKPDAFLLALHARQSFYTLLGEVSVPLTSLMFVAASLGARLINEEGDPKVLRFPFLSALRLLGAALVLPRSIAGGLDAAAGSVLLLVMVGLHNAGNVTLNLALRTPP